MVDLAISYSKATGCSQEEAKRVLKVISLIIKENIAKESIKFNYLGRIEKRNKDVIIKLNTIKC